MPASVIRILVSRHSAFYSPLLSTIAGGFLAREGLDATYGVLPPGAWSRDLIRAGQADVIQSAVSSSWGPMERGERDLPVHFAQITRRDGFFLTGRTRDPGFHWKKLDGSALVADHAGRPLAMLKYAACRQGVDWSRVRLIDAGNVDQMDAAFRAGQGDYVHQQGPAAQQMEMDGVGHVVASVGEAMPPVAFSSLTASREFLATERAAAFLAAYRKAREWVVRAPAGEVARVEAGFFPGCSHEALAAAIARYQALGCWEGPADIPRDLYDQALEVFLFSGLIRQRHRYEDVVVAGPQRPEAGG